MPFPAKTPYKPGSRRAALSLFLPILCSAAWIGCMRENPASPPESSPSGQAQVLIHTGRVGALAKTATIDLVGLDVTLTAPGESAVSQSIPLSGNAATTVSHTFTNLASLKTWSLAVQSRDQNGQVIHSGSTSFQVMPRQTASVSLNLSALYSMLKANVFPIRDSVIRVELRVDGVLQADSSFAKQSRLGDTISLEYDYLTTGANHYVKMDVYGEMWGSDTLLYTEDTTLTIAAGQDASYALSLKWVGPRLPPPGQASMSVALGAVGNVRVDGELEAQFKTTGSMTSPRGYGNTFILVRLDNGLILAAGGSDFTATLASVELYNPATGFWTATGSMSGPRSGHIAVKLADGRVLVAGGTNGSSNLYTAEIYDPATGTWTTTGSMAVNRHGASAFALGNGKVLVTAGSIPGSGDSFGSAASELYDPATGTWSSTGSMGTARMDQVGVKLADGRILIAGGMDRGVTFNNFSSAEIYDPTTGAWTNTGSMAIGRRCCFTLTLLPSGKVLVAGGGVDWTARATAQAEIFDPAAGLWTATASLPATRQIHSATLLPNGKVLVAAGNEHPADFGIGTYVGTGFLFDPASDTWSNAANALSLARGGHKAALLQNGAVLLAGGLVPAGAGHELTATAEIYGN